MAEPSPDGTPDTDAPPGGRGPHRRPRWVSAAVLIAVLLLAVVVVLHLTGNSLGGPGSHLP
jgi:hypothetical protein